MKPKQATALTRMIWLGRFKEAVIFVAVLAAILALPIAYYADVTLSVSYRDCTYLRWTEQQDYYKPPNKVVYCDLPDGTTIMARANRNWVPPSPGSAVRLRVAETFFGTRYRVE
jgi:hypothetical protein